MMKIPRITLFIPLALGSVLPNSGCTSMSSTFMQRQEDDQLLGISNGKPGTHNHARPFKGIPVTLQVPTHIDISIEETLLVVKKNSKEQEGVDVLEVQHLDSGIRQLNVTPKVVYSDKVFTVDPKRPAAGSLDYSLEFDNKSQYFKSIKYVNVDETINDINAVIAGLKPVATEKKGEPTDAERKSSNEEENDKKDVKMLTRTLAWKRFDLQAPDLEDQIAVFAAKHLQECQAHDAIPSEMLFQHGSRTTAPNPVQVKLSDNIPTTPKPTRR